MKKILGLDLGTNSIGFALIEYDPERSKGRIIKMGTRIFQEGVVNLNQGEREQSKNAARNTFRNARKQIERRRRRRIELLSILIQHQMAPDEINPAMPLSAQVHFRNWVSLNPYELRYKSIREKISLTELGRVLYHLAQHRGFQSNARNVSDSEDSVIYKGGNGMAGIDETTALVQDETLGSALFQKFYPTPGEPYTYKAERIRRRYTTRQMYVYEFERIWDFQKAYHPALTEELKSQIGARKREGAKRDGVLFFQRPLRSQKTRIGKCTFHPNKSRRAISAPDVEEFRIWQFINSIRCNNKKLDEIDRKDTFLLLCTKTKIDFQTLRKHIHKESSGYSFNYDDEHKCPTAPTTQFLSAKKIFGRKWFEFDTELQNKIWHDLYFFDDKELLAAHAIKTYGLSPESAKSFGEYSILQGYASLSHKAISNILPFLRRGYDYDVAVTLGGIRQAGGTQFNLLETDDFCNHIESIVRSQTSGGYLPVLTDFLQNHHGFSVKLCQKLYHHSEDVFNSTKQEKLPIGEQADKAIQKLRNPIVIQALFELRKVINELLDRYGPIDQIKIEMGRDLKNPRKRRIEIQRQNRRQEAYHDDVVKELISMNIPVSHDNILRYKLWEECNRTCPYTGRPIGQSQLFSNLIQIEHIVPYSRSLDDSFGNKTLCFSDENSRKGDRTPYEYYHDVLGEKEWEAFVQRALSIFRNSKEFPGRYKKFERLVLKSTTDLEGFISRQLNDTRYISREAAQYLKQICDDVWVVSGQLTSRLRSLWGLNTLIGTPEDQKSREDQRHHAIDALVVAVHLRKHLQRMSVMNRYYTKPSSMDDGFPFPWEGFRNDTEQAISHILVSYKTRGKVVSSRYVTIKRCGKLFKNRSVAARDALHKETIFGKRKNFTGKEAFHVRKSLESIKDSTQMSKIVDPALRKIISNRLQELNVDISLKKYSIPNTAFFEKDEAGQIHPKIWLPNKRGEKVSVYSIRVKEELGNAVQLKEPLNQYVNPRNNHHVLIYRKQNGQLEEAIVSFWEVVERIRQKQPIVQLPHDGVEMVTTLKENDMFLLGYDNDVLDPHLVSKYLYRVQKLSSKDYNFRHHLASKIDNDSQLVRVKSLKKWQELRPVKIELSPTGEILKLV